VIFSRIFLGIFAGIFLKIFFNFFVRIFGRILGFGGGGGFFSVEGHLFFSVLVGEAVRLVADGREEAGDGVVVELEFGGAGGRGSVGGEEFFGLARNFAGALAGCALADGREVDRGSVGFLEFFGEFFEGFGGGFSLAESAVDDEEVGDGAVAGDSFFENLGDGEVVVAVGVGEFESAVAVRVLGAAEEGHEAAAGPGAAEVGNVEALDAEGEIFEGEFFLEGGEDFGVGRGVGLGEEEVFEHFFEEVGEFGSSWLAGSVGVSAPDFVRNFCGIFDFSSGVGAAGSGREGSEFRVDSLENFVEEEIFF